MHLKPRSWNKHGCVNLCQNLHKHYVQTSILITWVFAHFVCKRKPVSAFNIYFNQSFIITNFQMLAKRVSYGFPRFVLVVVSFRQFPQNPSSYCQASSPLSECSNLSMVMEGQFPLQDFSISRWERKRGHFLSGAGQAEMGASGIVYLYLRMWFLVFLLSQSPDEIGREKVWLPIGGTAGRDGGKGSSGRARCRDPAETNLWMKYARAGARSPN